MFDHDVAILEFKSGKGFFIQISILFESDELTQQLYA